MIAMCSTTGAGRATMLLVLPRIPNPEVSLGLTFLIAHWLSPSEDWLCTNSVITSLCANSWATAFPYLIRLSTTFTYVPYVLQLRKRLLDPDMPLPTAFRMSTDGFRCPISVAYTPASFAVLAKEAGLETTYVGTSISQTELHVWKRYGQRAITDSRLAEEHRAFLGEISIDGRHIPSRFGTPPGINLVLELSRR